MERTWTKRATWMTAVLLLCVLLTWGCSDSDDDNDRDAASPDAPATVTAAFGFEEGLQGWEGDFSDYGFEFADLDSLTYEYRDLPESLNMPGKAPFLSGANSSDDLFMFMKRRLDSSFGILPDTLYRIDFYIEFATDSPSGCVGIGGPPGEAVRVKAGATTQEPEAVVVDEAYVMNIRKDRGLDPDEKLDMVTIGHVGNTISDCHDWIWEIKTLEYEGFEAQTDENGELWLIVGTDSGFEGTTSLYYTSIEAVLTPIEAE